MKNKSTTLTLAAMLCLGLAPRQVLAVSPAEIAFPVEEGTSCEHTYSNGFCTQCGELQADYLKPETDGFYNLASGNDLLWWSRAVAANTPNASARLTADIDMEGITMTSIGEKQEMAFRGTFDGQGHVIRNLKITGTDRVGLFRFVTGGSYVRNFIMDSSCSISGEVYCGIIASVVGSGSVNIEGIGQEGTVTATGINAAGIVGVNPSACAILMSDCYVTGKVTGGSESAAMCAWVGGGAKLDNLWACGEVEGMEGEKYLYRGDVTWFRNSYGVHGNQGTIITQDQVQFGALAYMLNQGRVTNPVWRQTLGTDLHPVMDKKSGIVFCISYNSYGSLSSASEIPELGAALKARVESYCSDLKAEKALLDDFLAKAAKLPVCEEVAVFCDIYTEMMELDERIVTSTIAYERYMERCAEISRYLEENDHLQGEGIDALLDYLTGDEAPSEASPLGQYGYITEQHVASAEQLEAEMERVEKMYNAALAGAYEVGQDITNLLVNADFSQKPDWTGWEGVEGYGLGAWTTKDNRVFTACESWQKPMDLHQTVSGLRPGYYLVSMNGAYRHNNDRYSVAYSAQLYAGGNNVYLPTSYETRISADEAVDDMNCNIDGSGVIDLPIYADGGTASEEAPIAYALHGVAGMAYAIASERAINHVVAYVGADGKLTFGVRLADNSAKGNWMGFGNFRLTFCGQETDTQAQEAVKMALDEQTSRANTILTLYKVDDLNPEAAPNYPLELKTALQTAVTEAMAATTVEDQMKCIARYSELFNLINEGKTAYLSLYNTAGLLEAAGTVLKESLSKEQYDDIMNASKTLYDAYADGIYSTAEANHPALLDIEAISQNIPEIDANGVIYINSLRHMLFLSGYVNNGFPNASARLEADITGVTEAMVLKDFRGTLDGNYHTIEYNINHPAANAGLIELLGGTVKNLYLKGTLTTDNKFAGSVAGNTANSAAYISNVVSNVTIKSNVDGDGTHGGFVGYTGSELTITNSMFAGSIEGEKTSCCGGFVGWLDATSSIYNCLMMGDMKVIADGGNTWARNPDRLNIADSYYLTPHAAVAGLPITAEQLESGEGCYLLNGSKNKNPGWYQTLGTDKIPYPDPSHKRLGATYDGKYTNDESKFAVDHTGTKEDPYVLATADDLLRMHGKMRLGEITYFVLNNDIDMSPIENWTPLNLYNDAINDRHWQAWIDLDGKGHVLRNFKTSGSEYNSFFGIFCGNLRNIGFEDVDVYCENTGSGVLGGYVGHSDYSDADRKLYTSTVENVWVTGKLRAMAAYSGGMFGNVAGPTIVRNCYVNIDFTSEASINGGIAGRVRGALTLENCYAAGTIKAGSWGGIIGGGQQAATPACTYKNIVVWNNTVGNFGKTVDGDKVSGVLNYDGTNFAELQKAVVAWDPTVWSCTMEEGAYPVLLQNLVGVQPAVNDGLKPGQQSVYTLTGVRVQKPEKGIYIVNGRKVMVK